jgi:hypothetical protein
MPSISEFITELDQQQSEWDERVDAFDGIEQQYAELLQLVGNIEQKLNMAIGDRVRHSKFGPGSIKRIEGEGSAVSYRVLFDGIGLQLCGVPLSQLEKLSEGDDGFARPAAKLEHNSPLPMPAHHDEYQAVSDSALDDDSASGPQARLIRIDP